MNVILQVVGLFAFLCAFGRYNVPDLMATVGTTMMSGETSDWCGGHDVPESKCTICNPELIPGFKAAGDWCEGHRLPESVCPECNHAPAADQPPQTVTNTADWCAGHDVPESKCTICNPELIPGFKTAGDWCEGHRLPESVCPECNHAPAADQPRQIVTNTIDWCAGHGVPESKCSACNPSIIPAFKAAGDWCENHQYPESVCPTCNPLTPPVNVADWCLEHALPESKCTLCNPALLPVFKAAGDWCAAHGFPESVCPTCQPQEPPAGVEIAALEARIVRFRTPEIETAADIQTVPAVRTRKATHVQCTARIVFDTDRIADLRAPVPGLVRKIHVSLGEKVKQGDLLFELESARVGDLQADLLAARERVRVAKIDLDRHKALDRLKVAPARELDLARQELAAAQSQVDASETALQVIGVSKSNPAGRYSLNAPITGTVMQRPAVIGLHATASTSLATIADNSVMWIYCDVPETEAWRIAPGQHVTISSGENELAHSTLDWVSPEVDPRTRTVTARARVRNPDGRLRANQFVQATIETTATPAAVSVPREAIQRVGSHHLVFVRTAPGIFAPRVVTWQGSTGLVQVEGNLKPGEPVVTTGAVLLRTEVMPGSIGAGCCEVDISNETN